jgi:hypothetical protein
MNSQAVRIARVKVNLGIMERQHCRGESELNGTG